MKKTVFSAMFAASMLLTVCAHADDCNNVSVCNDANTGVGLTFAPIAATTFAGLASISGKSDSKTAYIAAVKDDAAEFLVDGTVSALLAGAFEALRQEYPQANSLNDQGLATALLNAN